MAIINDGGGNAVDPEVARARNKVAAARATQPSADMLPEENFSDQAIARRKQAQGYQDYAAIRTAQNQAAAIEAQRNPNVTSWSDPAQSYRDRAAKLIADATKRNENGSLSRYPTLMKALTMAAANGADINEQDLLRLTNYAEVDRAANMILASPDDQRRKNILLSASPVMRAAILDVVEAKGSDFLKTLETSDQNWFVEKLTEGVGLVMEPFARANELGQHALRAMNNYTTTGDNPLTDIIAPARIPFNWSATETGKFDMKYIDSIKASGQYKPVEVDVMFAIAQAQAQGDPDPIMSALSRFRDVEGGPEVIRKLIYKTDYDPRLEELGRQIDSANLGSAGQMFMTGMFSGLNTEKYSDYRGTKGREQGANAASVFYTFTADPTLAAGKLVGAYRVAKFALEQFAPGKSATTALKSFKVAGVETNPMRRYVDNFTADLNKLDELAKTDKVKAAAFRTVMARQYKEFPEDVIEEFRKQGVRSTEHFAQFVDETNDAFLASRGEPAQFTEHVVSAFNEVPFYERLYEAGDMGRRVPLAPTKSLVRVTREKAVRAINQTVMPEKRARAVIDAYYGDKSTQATVEALDGKTADVTRIGRMDQKQVHVEGDQVGGWMGRRVDGLTRLFASLPNKAQIYTGDARDAGTFYKFARSFLTKRHADFLTEAFRDATPGQRRLMVAGVIRTAAGARGVALRKEDVLAKIDELATGTRDGELYSAGQKTEMAPATGDLATDVDNTLVYRPSSVNGHEHALHLWQTTEAVHIPSIRELESLKAYRDLMPDWMEAAPQRITDAWSLGTLYGLRFAIRSSVEDLWMYAVTAGRLPYLYQGRRVSTGLRDARPNIEILRYKSSFGSHTKGDPILDKDGNAQIVIKSRLGMFGKRARAIGDKADNGTGRASQLLGMFMLDNLDEAGIIKAHNAAKAGDWGPTRELIGEALTRQRLTTLKPQDIEDFKDLANSQFGLKQMDELAETARYINQGGYPMASEAMDMPGVAEAMMPANPKTVFGDFVDVPNGDPNFGLFWFRNIQGVAENDGVIGKLAIANIENPAKARNIVAKTIREDTKFGYKEQFSALYTGALTPEEFAQRYVDDVLHMFSGKDGLNVKLLDRIAPVGEDGRRMVSMYETVEGQNVLKFSPRSMSTYRNHGAPDYILGQMSIPMPKDDTALLDKAWGWMGEQYARIAREPVFLANYKEQRGILREYEKTLTDAFGEKAARAHTARMASDRAYGYTLSYVDNPENRSQMAWKIRNVSRYYRATEDFYRRMFRVAKNSPEAFWKTALTYQVLDDTGFVFADDNGNKYFAYPGTQLLQHGLSWALQPLIGDHAVDLSTSFLGGQVKMMAPSTDPNQALPQAMGPIAVWSSKFIFDKFPQFDGLERYITGEYAQNQSWYEVLLPAAVTRAMNGLNDDERQSMYGNAIMDAFAIATANGMVPSKTPDGVPIESFDQLQQTPFWQGIQNIAWGTQITKLLLGYAVPASPQTYIDNVNDYARAHGIPSMRSAFLHLIKQHSGEDNPVQQAFIDWWRMNPKGDLMPFTVSKTENDRGNINKLADVQSVAGLRTWYKENKSLYEKYPNAALFLAPREGEFSWGSWSLISSTLGLKEGKDFEGFVQDVLTSKVAAQHYATYDDYQRDIDALDPNDPEQSKQINQLTKDRSADLQWLRDNNPMWNKKYNEDRNFAQQDAYAQIAYNQTKIMVDDLKAQGADTPASRAIRSAIYTYEDYMSDIKGVTGSTNAEDAQKRLWKQQLAADLQSIAEGDPNAKVFIENVLYRTPEMTGDR